MNDQTSQSTISFYDTNAEAFASYTQKIDFSAIQDEFLSYLPKDAYILDFGCGAGRDTKRFLDLGYKVDAIDGSAEMCKCTEEYAKIKVSQMLFTELAEENRYDGIWACASVLHLPYEKLEEVFGLMAKALKPGGYIYTSFKYGEFEGQRNGRYFTYLTEEKCKQLLNLVDELEIEKLRVTQDVREGRGDEPWLNLILHKKK